MTACGDDGKWYPDACSLPRGVTLDERPVCAADGCVYQNLCEVPDGLARAESDEVCCGRAQDDQCAEPWMHSQLCGE